MPRQTLAPDRDSNSLLKERVGDIGIGYGEWWQDMAVLRCCDGLKEQVVALHIRPPADRFHMHASYTPVVSTSVHWHLPARVFLAGKVSLLGWHDGFWSYFG